MGVVLRFPKRRHARASSLTNASIGTDPPVARLILAAMSMDGRFLLDKISDKYPSEQPTSSANPACVAFSLIQTLSGCGDGMLSTLADSELESQRKTSPLANGPLNALRRPWGMGRRRADRAPLVERELYLGAWLARLGHTQARLAEKLQISPAYMSEIVNGKKDGPNIDLWMDIALTLEIPLEALFRRPPDIKTAASVEGLSDATIKKLSRRRG